MIFSPNFPHCDAVVVPVVVVVVVVSAVIAHNATCRRAGLEPGPHR